MIFLQLSNASFIWLGKLLLLHKQQTNKIRCTELTSSITFPFSYMDKKKIQTVEIYLCIEKLFQLCVFCLNFLNTGSKSSTNLESNEYKPRRDEPSITCALNHNRIAYKISMHYISIVIPFFLLSWSFPLRPFLIRSGYVYNPNKTDITYVFCGYI